MRCQWDSLDHWVDARVHRVYGRIRWVLAKLILKKSSPGGCELPQIEKSGDAMDVNMLMP